VRCLFESFEQEGIAMPYTMKDFRRDFVKEHFTPEERLEGLTPEERLQGLPPDEIEDISNVANSRPPHEDARRRKLRRLADESCQ
jgi:hypothetical protein